MLLNYIYDNLAIEDIDGNEAKDSQSKVLTNGPTIPDFHKR